MENFQIFTQHHDTATILFILLFRQVYAVCIYAFFGSEFKRVAIFILFWQLF